MSSEEYPGLKSIGVKIHYNYAGVAFVDRDEFLTIVRQCEPLEPLIAKGLRTLRPLDSGYYADDIEEALQRCGFIL